MGITTGSLGTGGSANLLQEGIRKLVGDRYRRRELEAARYLNMQTSSKNYEFDREVTTIGSLSQKIENGPIAMFDPRVGREKKYTHVAFAGGVRASREASDDERYGFIKRIFAGLGDAANETENLESAKMFNLCDSGDTGFLTGFDGLALLHDAHTGPNGEALAYNDNRLAADLSESVLQSTLIQFEKVSDAQGNQMTVKPQRLIVAPDNMFLVKEILQSQGKPFTPDNTINVLRGILDVIILHYATDPDRWLVQGQDHDMNFIMRTAPTMDAYDDKSTKSIVRDIFTRFTYGFGDWRQVIGSVGV